MSVYNFSVGDVIKSYDFRGNKDCYVVGAVTDMNTDYLVLDVFLEIWQDKILNVEKRRVRTSVEVFNGWTDRLVKIA